MSDGETTLRQKERYYDRLLELGIAVPNWLIDESTSRELKKLVQLANGAFARSMAKTATRKIEQTVKRDMLSSFVQHPTK